MPPFSRSLPRLLFTTHVRRYHRKYETTGGLWQGRFKAFPIQQDHHLEAESIRTCIQRQRPFGAEHWVGREAHDLGLLQSVAPIGRPRLKRPSK
jgi:hypothetical protein